MHVLYVHIERVGDVTEEESEVICVPVYQTHKQISRHDCNMILTVFSI